MHPCSHPFIILNHRSQIKCCCKGLLNTPFLYCFLNKCCCDHRTHLMELMEGRDFRIFCLADGPNYNHAIVPVVSRKQPDRYENFRTFLLKTLCLCSLLKFLVKTASSCALEWFSTSPTICMNFKCTEIAVQTTSGLFGCFDPWL